MYQSAESTEKKTASPGPGLGTNMYSNAGGNSPYAFSGDEASGVADFGGTGFASQTKNGPVWYEQAEPREDPYNEGLVMVDTTIHVDISFLVESDRELDLEDISKDVQRNLRGLGGTLNMPGFKSKLDPNGEKTRLNIIFDVNITERKTVQEVPEDDLLLVFVDYVYDDGGKSWGGVATKRGRIGYVASWKPEMEFIKDTATHEIGHMLGLDHSWVDRSSDTGPEGKENKEKSDNYMSYKNERSTFAVSQRRRIWFYVRDNELGVGSNTQSAPFSTYAWVTTATNLRPFDLNVTKGDLIPHIINLSPDDASACFTPMPGGDGHDHEHGHDH